jgi:PAS domain S-box-containing protein
MTLSDSEAVAQFHALAETTPDALVTIDTESCIQFVNPDIETILGYTPDELLGESLTKIMPDDLEDSHLEAVDRYLSTGTRQLDWNHVELPGQHKDGHEVPLVITFSEFTSDGERLFTGIIRDVSSRKTLESERDLLKATEDELLRADVVDDALRNILRLLGESMNWLYGEAWVPADGRDTLRCDTTWTAEAAALEEFREQSIQITPSSGKGLVGRVWETGEYEWIPDVSTAPEPVFTRTDIAEDAGLKAALAVPIRTDESIVGVMVFLMAEAQSVDERMVEVTRAVGANLGLLMARKQAEDALQEQRNLVTSILETSPIGIVVIDADGEFTYVNDRAEEILWLEPDREGNYPTFEAAPFRALDVEGAVLPESEVPYHKVLRTGDDVASDIKIEHEDGAQRWVSQRGTPLRDESGAITQTIFAFEDITDRKRREKTLERLTELGQELAEVETFENACERAATAACDVFDLPVTTIDRYDAETGSLEPCARTARVDGLAGEDPVFDSERGRPWQAFVQNETRVLSDLNDATGVDADDTQLSSALLVPIGEHGVLISGATDPDAFAERTVTLAELLSGTLNAVFDRLEREAQLRERTSELERKNDRLRRVQRINSHIRGITESLLDATSKAEIKQLVCDRLANSDPYRFVWFGERDFGTESITASAAAGVEEGYLDEIDVTTDPGETETSPAERAIQTHEVEVQNNLHADPPFEPWRQEAMQRGYRASIAIPVVYNETLYGLLNIYAGEPELFSEMEQAVLTELGEMIGYALNAMERYDALVSEESVELEFLVRDFSDPLLQLLRDNDGRIRLENIGSREAGSLQVFVAFEDLAFETIRSFFEEHLGSHDVTLVRDRNDESIAELTFPEESFLVTLLDRGAMPTDITATPAEARTTIRVPQSASVRDYVEIFDQYYDDAELVARRESPNPVQTREEFERVYVDRLTERQQDVLQTAYFAGFFEQPRDNSAGDIAEMLDVSQPTVSRHLRNSQAKLMSMLFGDT